MKSRNLLIDHLLKIVHIFNKSTHRHHYCIDSEMHLCKSYSQFIPFFQIDISIEIN